MGNFVFIPVIAFCCYGFLLIAFMAAKKTKEINSFIFALSCGLMWTGGSALMRMGLSPLSNLWYNLSLLGLFMLAYALLIFVLNLTDTKISQANKLWPILIFLMTTVNYLTGWFLPFPEPIDHGNHFTYVYTVTPLVSVFFIVCGFVVANIFLVIYKTFKENEVKKNQIKPILIGIIVIFGSQLILFLPIKSISGFPVDVLSAVFMVMCMFYVLYKKKLFTLTLLFSKGACYIAVGLLSIAIFSNFIGTIEKFVNVTFQRLIDDTTLIVALAFMGFTGLLYMLMKTFIDKVFIKDEIHRADSIKEFSDIVSKTLRINEILENLVRVTEETIGTKKIFVFIKNPENSTFDVAHTSSPLDDKDFCIDETNPLVKQLEDISGCLLMKDFRCLSAYKSMWDAEKNAFDRMGINCFVPLNVDHELVGIIAISKTNNKGNYSYNDINFLSSISSVSSIAVKNSRLYEKAFMEARTDELTGLLNRKYFHETLESQCRKAKGHSLALVMLNVDDFKLYNELYGYKEGDKALKRIAEIISATVGENGFAARYSGKEFGIILPGYDILSAKVLAENIKKQILNVNKASKEYAFKALTISGGVSAIPYSSSSAKELVSDAEMVVFHIKRHGKNKILSTLEDVVKKEKQNSNSDQTSVYSEYETTIYALTATIDSKDHYTFNHSKNVDYYASELGKAYGLNESAIGIIKEAALLHDIGKVGIPESILNKPGKLTDEEYRIMQEHVDKSVGIIRYLPSLDYVIPAVIGHHERYDGRGYPRRIAGEDIPLFARILCIADSFDAMLSSRSYKDAYPVEYALGEIEKNCGSQFDPKLATLFVQLVRENKIKPVLAFENPKLEAKEA